MKYLIILYATYTDGKDKKAMYEADTCRDAISAWHGYCNTYERDDTVNHLMCLVIDSDGMPVKTEIYDNVTEDIA